MASSNQTPFVLDQIVIAHSALPLFLQIVNSSTNAGLSSQNICGCMA